MTFPFPFFCPSSIAPKVLTYQTTAFSASALTTYTFSAQAIGTAASDRRVIVGIHGSQNNVSVSSVTIGGVTADIITQVTGGSGAVAAIAIALVPSGTTADVVVTFSGSSSRAAIGVWSCTGLTANAAKATGTSTADPAPITIDTNVGGFAIGMHADAGNAGVSWTNATERFETHADGSIKNASGADASTVGGNLTITADMNDSDSRRATVAASW